MVMTRMVVVGTLGCKHNIKLDRTKTKVKKEHRKKSENKVSVRGHAYCIVPVTREYLVEEIMLK